MKTKARLLIAAAVFLAYPGIAVAEKRISLRFTPKENVTASTPTLEGADPSRPIEVLPLKDVRALPDLAMVGENRERRTPRPVLATSSVAEFATAALRQCLSGWGVRVEQGGLRLKGEITNLLVTEEQAYSTQVSIRFQLEDASGSLLWEGVVSGDASQWGRSYSEENYREQISDALKRTYARLLSTAAFQRAWAGKKSQQRNVVTPPELKETIVRMMAEGIGADVIVQHVMGFDVRPALTADDMIDWKRAGISDAVLKATVPKQQ
jgi:hypothetical protein